MLLEQLDRAIAQLWNAPDSTTAGKAAKELETLISSALPEHLSETALFQARVAIAHSLRQSLAELREGLLIEEIEPNPAIFTWQDELEHFHSDGGVFCE